MKHQLGYIIIIITYRLLKAALGAKVGSSGEGGVMRIWIWLDGMSNTTSGG